MTRKSTFFEPLTSLVLAMLMIPMLAHTGAGESAKSPAKVYDRSGMWINRDGEGFMVVDVAAGGAAQAAGLKVGDRILAVDNRTADEIGLVGLRNRFRAEPAGTSIHLRTQRAGKDIDVTLVLKDIV